MLIFSPIKQFINSIKKLCLEIFIPNRKIRRILKGEMAKNYLKKYIKSLDCKTEREYCTNNGIENYTIWQFWDSGAENAPDIVKRCIESIDKFEPDKRHIVLDLKNISEYVELPERYYTLLSQGKMKMAHFSDILRTYLLLKYGGCWIDSTVLLTGKIPDYIINSDFFVFQNELNDDLDGLNLASYFIHSKPDNKFLKEIKELLLAYWSDNSYLMNYFLYLHALTAITQRDETNKQLWQNVPFVSFVPVQHFQNELLNPYNEQKWEIFKRESSIHKLSFKPKTLGLNKVKNIDGTYYDRLLKGELV
ncbi:MAG: capsular polysaccharide synthesis protein [Candidatus Gastranaerophilaceae bacterium]